MSNVPAFIRAVLAASPHWAAYTQRYALMDLAAHPVLPLENMDVADLDAVYKWARFGEGDVPGVIVDHFKPLKPRRTKREAKEEYARLKARLSVLDGELSDARHDGDRRRETTLEAEAATIRSHMRALKETIG